MARHRRRNRSRGPFNGALALVAAFALDLVPFRILDDPLMLVFVPIGLVILVMTA